MATLLQDLLSGSRHGPSDSLAGTFRYCARNPSESISTRLRDMLETFYQHYGDPERGVRLSNQAGALYYRVLEAVIHQESMRLSAKDLSGILEHDLFQRSLVACCLEMVLFSHQPTGGLCFPLVIEMFSLAPYYFYKVIEPVLRAEEGLPPSVVRHLNYIEEQVLESLAWRRASPLWDNIRNAQEHIPACQQVMPPQYLEDTYKRAKSPADPVHLTPSCVIGPHGNPPHSPITLDDRYSSPPVGSDVAVGRATPVRPPQPTSVIVTGKNVVTVASATVTTNNGQSVTIPVRGVINGQGGISLIPVHVSVVRQPSHLQQSSSSREHQPQASVPHQPQASVPHQPQASVPHQPQASVPHQPQASVPHQPQASVPHQPQASVPHQPQAGGSLSLFLRKVYHLASRRLTDICVKLGICEELRLKIWTCFEYSLVHCTGLMLDRHLDQILMCAIYIMIKVTKEDMTFKHIMKCYKTQHHASKSVYRNVLIGRDTSASQSSPEGLGIENVPRDQLRPGREQRGHLIYFYNNVFSKKMEHFALRYSLSPPTTAGVETPPLSPYPCHCIGAPRRFRPFNHHPLYISSYKTSTPPSTPHSPCPGVLYYIRRSPSKRLREINNMIRTGVSSTRRRCGAQHEEGEEECGPLVKRYCWERPSAWQQRLRDMVNAQTRAQNQGPEPATCPEPGPGTSNMP